MDLHLNEVPTMMDLEIIRPSESESESERERAYALFWEESQLASQPASHAYMLMLMLCIQHLQKFRILASDYISV